MAARSEAPIEQWLSPSQAATRLEVSVARIKQLIYASRLRTRKTALGHLIDPASLEEFAATYERGVPNGGR